MAVQTEQDIGYPIMAREIYLTKGLREASSFPAREKRDLKRRVGTFHQIIDPLRSKPGLKKHQISLSILDSPQNSSIFQRMISFGKPRLWML